MMPQSGAEYKRGARARAREGSARQSYVASQPPDACLRPDPELVGDRLGHHVEPTDVSGTRDDQVQAAVVVPACVPDGQEDPVVPDAAGLAVGAHEDVHRVHHGMRSVRARVLAGQQSKPTEGEAVEEEALVGVRLGVAGKACLDNHVGELAIDRRHPVAAEAAGGEEEQGR